MPGSSLRPQFLLFCLRSVALALVLAAFFLPPFTLFAQRLSITPPDVTVEEGEYADFTVVLSSEPTANVTVTFMGGGGGDRHQPGQGRSDLYPFKLECWADSDAESSGG